MLELLFDLVSRSKDFGFYLTEVAPREELSITNVIFKTLTQSLSFIFQAGALSYRKPSCQPPEFDLIRYK